VSSLPDDSYEPPSASLFRRLYSKLVHPATPLTCAFCVRVSPCGKHLAALHLSGAVSVWHFPSLRKSKYWLLKDQPDAEVVNPSAASTLKLLCQHSPKKKELKSEFPVALEWWCRHDPTIGDSTASLDDGLVLVRSCGSLTVSSSTTLTNLLGDHPEYLAPHPMVCAPEGAQFLCLELERSLARRQRTTTGTFAHPLTQALTGEYPEWSLEEEAMLDERTMQEGSDGAKESEEEEIGYLAWMLLLFWQLLYWLTNDVRFLVWRGHVVSERYRLVQLQSSSPEQLYYNKIKAEEYGEALLLAQTYELESDLVYQSQWERSVPSMESISDYLSKVRCRAWVLHQCCAVVPAHLNPARELLLFGLRGTGLTVLINISSGEDCGEWLSELTLYDCEDVEQRQQVLLQEEQLSKQVTWQELTEAQLELIKIRYRLLRYLDRLLTYELLVGGGHLAPERYDAAAYSRLREQSSVAACRQFARDGDGDAVAVMWTHHGQATLPHRLALLSNFPPTLGPFEYRALLPACGVDGEVLQWQQGPLRDVDWCERHVSGIGDPDDSVEDVCGLYEAVKGVQGVPDGEPQLTAQMVSRWYQERARQLERECGLVDSALDLLKLGRERNVPGLEPLLQLLTSLEVLVYEAGYTHMSLDELSDMPSSHVLALMLDKSDGSNLLQRLREWVLPFLGRCEAAQAGARDALLSQYLCTLSRSNLAAVSNILKFATSSRQLLQEDALHTCAVECIYEIKAYDQLSVASVILDGLPRAADESVRESLQLLEVQLWGCELMHKRDVSVLPCDLRRMAAADAHQLYTKLAHAALKRSPPLSLKEWQSLLDDMLELQLKLLTSTEPGHCYTSVAEALLTSRQSEYINFGSSFLSLSPSPRDAARGRNPYLEGVSHHEAVHLVLNAARGYFNTAERYGDPALQFAKQCLDRLAEVQEKKLQEAVQVERDLMAALEILHEFGVDQLPLQVRLCSDRESIVKGAIERSPGACLQYWWRVLQLGQLLRLEGSVARRETTVLVMLATQAFKKIAANAKIKPAAGIQS
ncbi:Neuroblastoma-amplified sequence N-terminal, partial [Trinorchestia longiramus]